MVKLRIVITFVLLAIIFAFIFVFAVFIFNTLFIRPNLEHTGAFIGAFLGAFFTFLFIRIAEALSRFYQRKVKNYNALVKLEQLCNEYANIISDNIFTIDNFAKMAVRINETGRPYIFAGKLEKIPIDKEIPLCLTNSDFINELFSFNIDLIKSNNDMVTLNSMHISIKEALIKKAINIEAYKDNMRQTSKQWLFFSKFLKKLDDTNKRIVAITRVLLKDKTLLGRLMQFALNKKLFTDKFETLISAERDKFEKEAEKTKEKSRKELRAVFEDKK